MHFFQNLQFKDPIVLWFLPAFTFAIFLVGRMFHVFVLGTTKQLVSEQLCTFICIILIALLSLILCISGIISRLLTAPVRKNNKRDQATLSVNNLRNSVDTISLFYLKNMPINTIKTGRFFIKNITHNSSNIQIVDIFMLMAKNPGIDVIQNNVLNLRNNCKFLQSLIAYKFMVFFIANRCLWKIAAINESCNIVTAACSLNTTLLLDVPELIICIFPENINEDPIFF